LPFEVPVYTYLVRYPPITSFLFGPNILLSTLFSNNNNNNVRDHVSHPYNKCPRIVGPEEGADGKQ
jgi:hypothetical protein